MHPDMQIYAYIHVSQLVLTKEYRREISEPALFCTQVGISVVEGDWLCVGYF